MLIAEDDTPIAAIVCAAIEDAGYHAVVARDGRQALELARSVGPSLVITDMMMPFLTGADLIRALREDAAAEQRSPVPTILMTAVSALSARSAGADALLRKPFDLDELDNLVNIYLTGGA